MAEPWFNPSTFGSWYGEISGAGGGILGGILGALAVTLAPRGKAKTLVLVGMAAFFALGVVSTILGLVAMAAGQPWGIWSPMLIVGVIFTWAMAVNFPVVLRRYREAESIRRG
jgi:hypothetical protein